MPWRSSSPASGSCGLASFSDAASVSDYAVSDLAAMVRMGIFQGGSDGQKVAQRGARFAAVEHRRFRAGV